MVQRSLNLWCLCLMTSILLRLSCYPAFAAKEAKAISPGMNLPQFSLDVPSSQKEQQYLGLENQESFSLSEIPAKLIIVEFFSAFCTACQKQAPIANKIYKFIQQDPDLSQDIKMIGIALGNKPRGVKAFRKKFRVPFPLFADPGFSIYEKLGKPKTPTTIVVANGSVLSVHPGIIEDIDEYLHQLRKFRQQE